MLGGFSNPLSRRDLEEWLESHRLRKDEVLWSIVRVADGQCLGHVGLYKIDPLSRSAEFGIMIGERTAWGKGYGREATRFALRYAFDQLNLRRVSLTVLATNERALRLYRSVGFAEEGRLREAQFREGEYLDVVCMGVLRAEFLEFGASELENLGGCRWTFSGLSVGFVHWRRAGPLSPQPLSPTPRLFGRGERGSARDWV